MKVRVKTILVVKTEIKSSLEWSAKEEPMTILRMINAKILMTLTILKKILKICRDLTQYSVSKKISMLKIRKKWTKSSIAKSTLTEAIAMRRIKM